TRVEVERLETEPGAGATVLAVVDRTTRRRLRYRPRRYALGAGAFGSALLLLRSGGEHPLIGRDYMMHLCAIVAGIYPWETTADTSFVKQLGFADYYFGSKKHQHKMGLVQSIAVPGPLMAAKVAPFVPEPVRAFLLKRSMVLSGMIE